MTHLKAVCISRARWKIRNILVLACIAAGLTAAAPNASASAQAKVDNGICHLAATSHLGTVPVTNITATHDPGTLTTAANVIGSSATFENSANQAQACQEGGAAPAVDIVAAAATNSSPTNNIALVATAPPNNRVSHTNFSGNLGNTTGINSANSTTLAGTIAGTGATDNVQGTMNNAPNNATTVELADCGNCTRAAATNTS